MQNSHLAQIYTTLRAISSDSPGDNKEVLFTEAAVRTQSKSKLDSTNSPSIEMQTDDTPFVMSNVDNARQGFFIITTFYYYNICEQRTPSQWSMLMCLQSTVRSIIEVLRLWF